jgi:signal peptidase
MESLFQYSDELKEVMKRPRKALTQVLNLGMVVFSALMLWRGLMLVTGSESPVVVVLSGSMEPGFHRGDILFLSLTNDPFRPGDVTVFQIEGREIPIVHRAHNVHAGLLEDHVSIVTKGDNNNVDDRGLYKPGQLFLKKSNVMGRAYAFIPFVGMVTIWLNDFPWLKYLLIGMMAFFVMIGRE